jgi:NADPH:quinone reductase-like Zn-dependent oxidoreductase
MKMKALVKSKPQPGIWLEDVPVPEIGINDVLIKIHKTSICGTDVHIYDWNEWAQNTIKVPVTLSRGTSYPVKDIWFAAAAAIALPAAGICA